jgi:hypothetical protein
MKFTAIITSRLVNNQPLSIFVITFDGVYVVNEQRVYPGGAPLDPGFIFCAEGSGVQVALEPHAVTLTLEEARAALPHGLVRMPPMSGDSPMMVEFWI